jgi:hypothetical protein
MGQFVSDRAQIPPCRLGGAQCGPQQIPKVQKLFRTSGGGVTVTPEPRLTSWYSKDPGHGEWSSTNLQDALRDLLEGGVAVSAHGLQKLQCSLKQ